MDKVRNTTAVSVLILSLALVSLLFINVTNSFDWGDDYAHYILKAKDIAENSNVSGLMTDEAYAPSVRPPVFPFLLAPVYWMFDTNPAAYHYFSAVVLVLILAVYWFYFFKGKAPVAGALITSLIALLPYTLKLKAELPVEFPMMLFIYLSFYFFKKENFSASFILILFACLTKYTAAALLPAFIICFLCGRSSLKEMDRRQLVTIALSAFLFIIFIFSNSQSVSWYSAHFIKGDLAGRIASNFNYYFHVLLNAFEQEVPAFVNLTIKCVALILPAAGIIISLRKKIQMHDLFFFFYLVVILIYDYGKGGFRFVFPVVPLIFFYMYEALHFLSNTLKDNNRYLVLVFVVVMLISYSKNIVIIRSEEKKLTGPQQLEFMNAVNFIKQKTDSTNVIFFAKPFLIPLYTGKEAKWIKSLATTKPLEGHHEIIFLAKRTEPELYNPAFDYLIKSESVLYENEKFFLLRSNRF